MQRELTQLSTNVSRSVNERETGQTDSTIGPEQDAAEQVKDGVMDSAFALADISASAARAAYLRGKAVREKVLQAKDIQHGSGKEKGPPALSDTSEKSPAAQRVTIPTEAQRRDKVRRQLYAQKAAAKQAAKEALRKTAGPVQPEAPPRLTHWRQDTKRRIFH